MKKTALPVQLAAQLVQALVDFDVGPHDVHPL
jgi:hypothetical protein